MCVLYGFQKTALISLGVINLCASTIETGSNYCAVRTEPLSVIHVNQSGTRMFFLGILRFSPVSLKFQFVVG
jgi:hypothetical protein